MVDEDVEIVLVRISHPALDAPIRLSTDATERLSIDPLAYGTRSTWPDASSDPYQFVLMSAMLPDDQDGQLPQAQLMLELVDADMVAPLRSTIERATIDLAVIRSSDLDSPEIDYRDLQMTNAEGDSNAVTLTVSGPSIWERAFPAGRFTRSRFPTLFRGG